MKKIALIIAVFSIVVFGAAAAVDVSRQELESAVPNPDIIEFINYSGPHSRIDTKEQILDIGRNLGKVVATSKDTRIETGNSSKYYLIHAVYPEVTEGLDADILILGDKAEVDHIKNLRLIITGFLTEAYGYNSTDASTLATFITVYNAVYRGKISQLLSRYKSGVIAELSADKMGLSVNYSEWAGKSQIIIPLLNPENGGLSTIDTSIISGTEVIQSMREEDDRMVNERMNMVDIKEREADEAEEDAREAQREAVAARKAAEQAAQQAAVAQQAAQEAKQQAAVAQQAAKQAEDTANKKQQEANQAVQEAKQNPQDPKKQEQAAQKQQEAQQAQQKKEETAQQAQQAQQVAEQTTIIAEQKQAEAEQRQEEADDLAEQAAQQQAFADKKRTEAVIERTAIANDQQKNISDAIRAAKIVTTYGLKLSDTENMYSSIVLIDVANGNVVKESPVSVILNRTLLPVEDGFIAIAGKAPEADYQTTAVKLVMLDNVDMEIIKQSEENVSPKSVLIENNENIYVVIRDSNSWVIASYDKELTLKAKSNVIVLESTPLIITDTGMAVTTSDGTVVILDPETLEKKW
ncbi:MAG: hypothetical protein J5647_04240 [Spirochaetaceae bacterium]|nr:hypothetical protein [Spirochaetaceae bacterium]